MSQILWPVKQTSSFGRQYSSSVVSLADKMAGIYSEDRGHLFEFETSSMDILPLVNWSNVIGRPRYLPIQFL
jgi:hypothetical protein